MTHDAPDFFAEHQEARSALEQFGNRYGQNIEASPVIDEGPFAGAVMVRHSQTRESVGVIWPDGRAIDLGKLRLEHARLNG